MGSAKWITTEEIFAGLARCTSTQCGCGWSSDECQRFEKSSGVAITPSITLAVHPGSWAYSLSELAEAPFAASAKSFVQFSTCGRGLGGFVHVRAWERVCHRCPAC